MRFFGIHHFVYIGFLGLLWRFWSIGFLRKKTFQFKPNKISSKQLLHDFPAFENEIFGNFVEDNLDTYKPRRVIGCKLKVVEPLAAELCNKVVALF